MTDSGRAWAPRKPKSLVRIWSRYIVQWLWGPPLWLLVRLPIILLTVLEVDVQGTGSSGSFGRPRWRRRMWIDRERLRLDRATDPRQQEEELRRLLTDHLPPCLAQPGTGRITPPRSGSTYRFARDGGDRPVVRTADGGLDLSCGGGLYHLTIEDSHYRVIGAGRALEIARAEFGWVPADGVEKNLPQQLQLRCP
ncbi:hypothetical protein ACFV3R_22145 [Streptomyces sp. NPDC059740]|uniref:hypothetical protein n=1 Tax=Streptomyces sp. NPDC059740 TaxID=3346926 RepID=UPI003658461A